TAASDASLIVASSPIIVLILSSILLEESLTKIKIVGVLFAFFGVLLVVGLSPNVDVPNRILGDSFIFIAAISYASYTVIYRKFINSFNGSDNRPSSLFVITWVSFIGFLCIIPLALMFSPEYIELKQYLQVPPRIWLGILYLSVFSTLGAYTMYLEGVKRLNASRASIFINLVPVVGVSSSLILLQEKLDPIVHLGALVLIITGVFLVNRKQ
ncbi:MAG: DMT family transporter, partial [Candidatus Hodarchaeales archaeon]